MGAVFLQVLSTLRENTSCVVAVFTRTMPVKTWRRSARDSYLKPETGRLICRLEQIARRLAVTPPPLDKPLRDWPRNLLMHGAAASHASAILPLLGRGQGKQRQQTVNEWQVCCVVACPDAVAR